MTMRMSAEEAARSKAQLVRNMRLPQTLNTGDTYCLTIAQDDGTRTRAEGVVHRTITFASIQDILRAPPEAVTWSGDEFEIRVLLTGYLDLFGETV